MFDSSRSETPLKRKLSPHSGLRFFGTDLNVPRGFRLRAGGRTVGGRFLVEELQDRPPASRRSDPISRPSRARSRTGKTAAPLAAADAAPRRRRRVRHRDGPRLADRDRRSPPFANRGLDARYAVARPTRSRPIPGSQKLRNRLFVRVQKLLAAPARLCNSRSAASSAIAPRACSTTKYPLRGASAPRSAFSRRRIRRPRGRRVYSTVIVVTLIHSVIQGQRGTAIARASRSGPCSTIGDDLGARAARGVLLLVRRRVPWLGPSAESTTVHAPVLVAEVFGNLVPARVRARLRRRAHVNMGGSGRPSGARDARVHRARDARHVCVGAAPDVRHLPVGERRHAAVDAASVAWIVTTPAASSLVRLERGGDVLQDRALRRRVPRVHAHRLALGPPWGCLGFDRGAHASGRLLR